MRTRLAAILLALAAQMVAAGAHAQYVVWLDADFAAPVLRRASPSLTGITSLGLPAGTLPEGLALARVSGQLVWTQAAWTNAGLQKGSLSLSSFAPLAGGWSVLHGIAENPVNGQLYFTSSNLTLASSVYRCESDGSAATTLVSYGAARNLRGIAVDGAAGKMFYADFDHSTILSANLDGSGVVPIANLAAGSGPWGVAVNPATQFVYWCEYGTGRIARSTYAGASQTTLFTGLANPTYLALDPAGGNLYWSEAGGTPRLRMGPIGGGVPGALTSVTSSYGGVAFVPASAVDVPVADEVRDVELSPIAPNPARAGASIAFALPRGSSVRLTVTDVQGRVVATLADGVLGPGRHRVTLASHDGDLSPGVYFVRLQTPGRILVRRVALVP
jgi:DNA-binding beta-propeller fold protein YncE